MAARKTTKRGGDAPHGGGLVPFDQQWADEMAAYAKEDAATATSGAFPFISTQGGRFTWNSNDLGQELDVIVLAAVFENRFYRTRFNPQERKAPDCFAVGREQDELAPPLEVARAAETGFLDEGGDVTERACKTCWANAWGSGEGRGKACGNRMRLGVIPADRLDLETLREVEGARLMVPPTSLKSWSAYVAKITGVLKMPTFALVTRITIEPGDGGGFGLTFQPAPEQLPRQRPLLQALQERRVAAMPFLLEPPQLEFDDAKAARGRTKRAPARGGKAAPTRGKPVARGRKF